MRKFTVLFSVIMVFALLLSACGTARSTDDNANLNGNGGLNNNGNLNGNTNGAVKPVKPVATKTVVAPVNPAGAATKTVVSPVNPTVVATKTVVSPVKPTVVATKPVVAPVKPTVVATKTVVTPVKPTVVAPKGTQAALPPTGMAGANLVSSLRNFEVYDLTCKQVGKVRDVVLDMNGQTISYVVVGLGGFLGLGERDVAVPFKSLTLNSNMGKDIKPVPAITAVVTKVAPITGTKPMTGTLPNPVTGAASGPCKLGDNAVLINASADSIKNAPEIKLAKLSGMGMLVEGWDTGFNAYWTGLGSPNAAIAKPMTAVTPMVTVKPMTAVTPMATVKPMTAVTPMATVKPLTTTVPMTGTQNTKTTLRGAVLASELIGAEVYGSDGKKLAMVEDVIINPLSGQLIFAIVKLTAPDGERLLPLPLKAFSWDSANKHFVLTVDKTVLEAAPYFKNGQFPDWTLSNWENNYRLYWDPFMPVSR